MKLLVVQKYADYLCFPYDYVFKYGEHLILFGGLVRNYDRKLYRTIFFPNTGYGAGALDINTIPVNPALNTFKFRWDKFRNKLK